MHHQRSGDPRPAQCYRLEWARQQMQLCHLMRLQSPVMAATSPSPSWGKLYMLVLLVMAYTTQLAAKRRVTALLLTVASHCVLIATSQQKAAHRVCRLKLPWPTAEGAALLLLCRQALVDALQVERMSAHTPDHRSIVSWHLSHKTTLRGQHVLPCAHSSPLADCLSHGRRRFSNLHLKVQELLTTATLCIVDGVSVTAIPMCP